MPSAAIIHLPTAGRSGGRARSVPAVQLPAAASGVLAVLAMEAGWVVTEVGRQPWIVHGYMTVDDGATANTAVWATFILVTVLYVSIGVTTVLVLRLMSRRFREADPTSEVDGPYSPRHPALVGAEEGDHE